MTFSILARCLHSGQFGIAISSSSLCVAARCAFARAGVGAVASQNITDPRLGTKALELLAKGNSAQTALEKIVSRSENIEYRQLLLVDKAGSVAHFSGANILGKNSVATAGNVIAAGNLLNTERVPQAMIDCYLAHEEAPLGSRLISAMQAGLEAGGEEGPLASAGMLIVDTQDWPLADLRIDKSSDPITDLAALWQEWQGEMEDYVTRALAPEMAPSYGVPGDE